MTLASRDSRTTSRRGFTLLEVLMAAIIISLGVLGITALFAGAARQQQIASQTTRSVIASKNGEAIIASAFGQINANQPTVLATEFPPDVWVRIPMDPTFHHLTLPGVDDPGTPGPDIYFLVAPTVGLPAEIYSATSTGADYLTLRGRDTHNAMRPWINAFQDLPNRRIDPFSVSEIRVTARSTPGATPQLYSYRLPARVKRGEPEANVWPDATGNRWQFVIDGRISAKNQDFIELNCRLDSGNAGPFASIGQFRIAGIDGNHYIDSIEVVDYRWRSDRLISLRDRLVYAAGSDQPSLGYSVLYRRTSDGGNQMALITYGLSARTPSGEWLPPERLNDEDGPLIELNFGDVTVHYDPNVSQHYVTMMNDDDARYLKPGQILFLQAELDIDGDTFTERVGADFAVRVARRQKVGPEVRGYLETAPRAAGQAMLQDYGSTVSASAWLVNESVRSLEDNSDWFLTPLEFRVFQLQ